VANPSVIQKIDEHDLEPANPVLTFASDVTAGNYLLCAVRWRFFTGAPCTISDSRDNVWAPIYADASRGLFLATAKDSGHCVISPLAGDGGSPFYNADGWAMEIDGAGATAFSNGASGDSPVASVAAGGVSIAVPLFGGGDSQWAAAMLTLNNPDGVAADGMSIVFVSSEIGFKPSPPSGWNYEFPDTQSETSFSQVLVGPGATGTPPPPGGGGGCPATCQTNLSDANPPAPATGVNVKFQAGLPYLDPNNPQETIRDISAYVGKATPTDYGVVKLLSGADDAAIEVNGLGVSADYTVTVNSFFQVNGTELWPKP
jgi:hypothetical protein